MSPTRLPRISLSLSSFPSTFTGLGVAVLVHFSRLVNVIVAEIWFSCATPQAVPCDLKPNLPYFIPQQLLQTEGSNSSRQFIDFFYISYSNLREIYIVFVL
jgi:hypothetical protein